MFTLKLRDDISVNHQVTINTVHKENITLSIQMIKECCIADCPSHISQGIRQNKENIEKIAAYNGEQEGVDKLYSIGKTFFAKYWILSGYGLKETTEAIEARETAERYLEAALKCEWSPQRSNQDKKFIAERLARVFICKGEYDQATFIIERLLRCVYISLSKSSGSQYLPEFASIDQMCLSELWKPCHNWIRSQNVNTT